MVGTPVSAIGCTRTERLDVRLEIPLLRRRYLPITTLFLEVRNFLNEENIDVIADPRMFESTGEPDNPFPVQSTVFIRHFLYINRSAPC